MSPIAAAAISSPGNPALSQFIESVASGLAVVILAWIARVLRTYVKQHDWLMTTTQANTKAIEENTRAIRTLLEERSRRR